MKSTSFRFQSALPTLLVVLFSLLFAGCATEKDDARGKPAGFAHLPPVLKPADAAEIVFIRNGGPPWPMGIHLNENAMLRLDREQYCRFTLDAGNAEFSIYSWGVWWPSLHKDVLAVALKPRQKYYFYVYEGFPAMRIKQLKETTALKKMDGYQLIQLNNQ